MTRLRVPIASLQVGDTLVATSRTVVQAPTRGLRTPRGRVELVVETKAGKRCPCCWGASTMVVIDRGER